MSCVDVVHQQKPDLTKFLEATKLLYSLLTMFSYTNFCISLVFATKSIQIFNDTKLVGNCQNSLVMPRKCYNFKLYKK